MYEIKRENNRVIIRKGTGNSGELVLNASDESYVIYSGGPNGYTTVSKLKDLTDDQLLIALAEAIPLKI